MPRSPALVRSRARHLVLFRRHAFRSGGHLPPTTPFGGCIDDHRRHQDPHFPAGPFCTRALEGAAGLCVGRSHYEVTVEHLLAKFLEESQSDIPLVLRQFNLDAGQVRQAVEQCIEAFRTGNAGKPVFSPTLLEWIQEGWLIASVDLSETRIRSGALLLALLARPIQFGTGQYTDLLQAIGRENLLAQFGAIAKASMETPSADERQKMREGAAPAGDGTAIARFCMDFTAKAKAGEIDPVFGRDNEIRQMIDILARRRKNNPIFVGEPGVGKTAVVEGMALRIVEGDVPDMLKGRIPPRARHGASRGRRGHEGGIRKPSQRGHQ